MGRTGICELCKREEVEITEHHLIPREEGGAYLDKANLCIPCHKQIHALYTNKELALRLNTIQALQQDEEIEKYLKWIKKQPSSSMIKTKRSKRNPKR